MRQLTLPISHVDDQWLWENLERIHPLPGQQCRYPTQIPTWVYQILSPDDSLYIGCTGNLPSRLRSHAEKFWWLHASKVTADLICCRTHALEYEGQQILQRRPIHNKQRPSADRFLSYEWVRHGMVGFDKEDL